MCRWRAEPWFCFRAATNVLEKYAETIRHFTDRGLWVATFDWRGQGLSDRLLKKFPCAATFAGFGTWKPNLSVFSRDNRASPETRLPFCMGRPLDGRPGGLVYGAPGLPTAIERMVLTAPLLWSLSNQPVPTWVTPSPITRTDKTDRLRMGQFRAGIGFPRPFEGNPLTRTLIDMPGTRRSTRHIPNCGRVRPRSCGSARCLLPMDPSAA